MKCVLPILLLTILPLIHGATFHYRLDNRRMSIEERGAGFTYSMFANDHVLVAEFSEDGEMIKCERKEKIASQLRSEEEPEKASYLIHQLIHRKVPAADVLSLVYHNEFQRICLSSVPVRRFRRQVNRGNDDFLIYPGTKWCGRGNIATTPNELGEEYEADECCMHHDKCANSLVKGQTIHGYTNRSPFTINSCECDETFKTCLQGANTVAANDIGVLFFNRVGMVCYRTRRRSCADDVNRRCKPNQTIFKEAYVIQLPRWVSAPNYDDTY